MKILYHHRTLADGAEGIHIESMVQAFRRLGHEVRVRGLAATQGSASRGLAATVRNSLPGPLLELASTAVNVPEYLQARSEIREFKPDFIYKRHARYDTGTLAAAKAARVPTVLEVNSLFALGAYHSFEPLRLRRLASSFERRALRTATVVVAVSTPLARQAEELAGRPISVLPNGADPELFDPARADPGRVRAEYGLGDRFTIGWTGILREWHGLELLLEAVANLPDAYLLIVGDGPARRAVEERAASRKIADRVIITGRVPYAEMPDYIAAMDVAVVADEKTGVASPMKLLEYMAMARAVVAPRMENILDLIEEGRDGLLFRTGEAHDMTRVLAQLGAAADLRARVGLAARQTIQRERNWLGNVRRVVALLTSTSA